MSLQPYLLLIVCSPKDSSNPRVKRVGLTNFPDLPAFSFDTNFHELPAFSFDTAHCSLGLLMSEPGGELIEAKETEGTSLKQQYMTVSNQTKESRSD